MKRILFLLLLVVSLSSFGQRNDTTKNYISNDYGQQVKRLKPDSILQIPHTGDTTAKSPGLLKMLGSSIFYVDWLGHWNELAPGVKISDTTSMLSNLLRKTDTLTMLSKYLRKSDTLNMLSNLLRKTDTLTMMAGYQRSGNPVTVAAQPNITSVGTLGALTVTGNVTAASFSGSGSRLTGIPNNALVNNGAINFVAGPNITLSSTSVAPGGTLTISSTASGGGTSPFSQTGSVAPSVLITPVTAGANISTTAYISAGAVMVDTLFKLPSTATATFVALTAIGYNSTYGTTLTPAAGSDGDIAFVTLTNGSLFFRHRSYYPYVGNHMESAVLYTIDVLPEVDGSYSIGTNRYAQTGSPKRYLKGIFSDTLMTTGVLYGGSLKVTGAIQTASASITGVALVGSLSTTGNVTAANLTNSTYTPTIANCSNAGTFVTNVTGYTRHANTVTVEGSFGCTPTGTGETCIYFSLPIASALTTTYQCGGAGAASCSTPAPYLAVAVEADASSDQALFRFYAASTNSLNIRFSFTYQIL